MKSLIVRFFSSSLILIRFIVTLLFPPFLLVHIKSWNKDINYLRILNPEQSVFKSLILYYRAQIDLAVWQKLTFNSYHSTLKYNDFSQIDKLKNILIKGNGLLILGMHYGPMCSGYLLYQNGLDPAILATPNNIPDPRGNCYKKFLTNEYLFRGNYEGFFIANKSEKGFIQRMLDGFPGMIMIDPASGNNNLKSQCLGIDFPINIFPFKLALKYSFPVAVIWLSKIRRRGYRLNVDQIHFTTIEDGINQYGEILTKIVCEDPCLWHFGRYFTRLADKQKMKN